MQIKTQAPISFLYQRIETTIAEMMEQSALLIPQLLRELLDQQLQLCGPVYWNYFGFTGDESKPFTLEIALPVMQPQQNYVGKFALRQSAPFRCVEVVHEGPWDQIPATYGKLMNFMAEHQLMPTFENRELYVNADFSNPQANITLIRMGIH